MIEFGPGDLVTLVADSGTPAELTQYAGIRLVWPKDRALPPLSQYEDLVILGIHAAGYLRNNNGNLQWVIQGLQDPIVAALEAIPGADGWQSDVAKGMYANIGSQLMGRGITLIEAKTALTQLYQSAVANYVAAHPAP
jgi:hypothetical protein